MTKELEPCPFCPDGGKPVRKFMTYFKSNGYWVECESCNSTSGQRKSREEADEAWNTRYKRTCHLVVDDHIRLPFESFFRCSECGDRIQNKPFCPNCGAEICGAEVVDDK